MFFSLDFVSKINVIWTTRKSFSTENNICVACIQGGAQNSTGQCL